MGCFSGSTSVLAGAFAWTLLVTLGSGPLPEFDAHLQEGSRQVAGGDLDQALLSWCRARRLSPRDPRTYIRSADALLQAGRKHDAVIELLDVLELPLTPAQALTVALLLEPSGMRAHAIDLLERHRSDPAFPAEGLWLLSDLLFLAEKPDLALTALDDFAAHQPQDPRIDMRRGRLLLQTGRLEHALTCFESVVAARPDDAEAFFQMATTLRLGNNPEAAERMARRAVELSPETAGYLHLLALLQQTLNRRSAALSNLIQASRSRDVFPRVYFDLGNLYRDLGDVQKSKEALLRYRDLQQVAEAEENRRQKILQLVNQGETFLHSGNIQDAVNAFQRALEDAPEEWDSLLFLAKIHLSSPHPEAALPHLQKLLEIDPESSEASFLAAFFQQEIGNTGQALEMAERSRRLRPASPELRNLTGNLYLALSRPEAALQEYQAACELAPAALAFCSNHESLARRMSVNP